MRQQEVEHVTIASQPGLGVVAEARELRRSSEERITVRSDGWAKRIFDVVVASVSLVCLSPVFLVCVVLAKAQSRGAVFYLGPRVGRGGRPFRMVKFRTMVPEAPSNGPGVTSAVDPRVTTIGRFLRRTKLDELPQLFNVLNGSMSLVGPRPELPEYVATYDARQLGVLSVRPGITGPTQLRFRHEEGMLSQAEDPEEYYVSTLIPAKLDSDLEYLARRAFWRDAVYLVQTISVVVLECITGGCFRREGG